MTAQPQLVLTSMPALMPPIREKKGIGSALFGDLISSIATLIAVVIALTSLPLLYDWAIATGTWSGTGDTCRERGGACWAFLGDKYDFILFGLYPSDERWRPILAMCLMLGAVLWTLSPRNWHRTTLVIWALVFIGSIVLMHGGVAGLVVVPTSVWGGLPVTLVLTLSSLAFGFPMAIMLALGRQSTLPAFKYLSVGFIELVRGLPLLSILFIASILLPIVLPDGFSIDKLSRAVAALTFFAAAYLAEVIRGGLISIPAGQVEAAKALGMSWWQLTTHIVLPQAVKKVLPPLTSTVVVTVKNTSLVLVIGIFDLLSAGRAALADPEWPAPYIETFLLVALIYFVICFGISRYAQWLEMRGSGGSTE